jgi:hypothetical protein
MKRPASRCCNDQGLEESVSVILVVILAIALAAIIASIVFGLVIFYPKSAYIAVQTEVKNVSPDNWYLSVFHMNGDAAYLNHSLSTNEGMPVDFQFTNATLGTVIPKPDPDDGPETWKPGDTLFVYNKIVNGNQSLWVTKNETTARNGIGLPIGVWRFDVVDRTDDVLIYTKNVGVGVPEPTPTSTIIPNTSVTTTVTTTIPTTNATTVPTTIATTTVTTTATTPPVVASINPGIGPIAGGTMVTITGTGFTGATSVSFGGIQATSFTVNSATQITAISPAQSNPGTINVIVTTPGGISGPSPPNDHFRYTN